MTTTNRCRSLATAAAVLALAVPSASLATSGPPGALTREAVPEQPCKQHWGATYTYAPRDCGEQITAPTADTTAGMGHDSEVGEAIALAGILAALVACAWFVWTLARGRGDATARVRRNA